MSEATAARTGAAMPAKPEQTELDPRRWTALLSVLTALFMVPLDISIVNVAIPAIRSNLSATNADIQFVVAGYGLAYALVLITGGRLGDIYGRKRLFMLGMAGFLVASASCGLAQSAVMLDISRVVQGVMAALMYPQTLSVIQVLFPPHERAKAFGILGAVIGIATITGPLVGGLIIRDDITGGAWRWIFLVNIPIGLASLVAAWRVLRESKAPQASRLDVVGVLIASVGLFLLVYPLVEGQDANWPLWTFVCVGLSPVVLALFVLYERSLPSSRFPLVQLSLFSIRSFRLGVVISALFLAGIPAMFLTTSLLLQVGLGFSALHAGLTTIPWSIGAAFMSVMSARLAPRLGKWTITVGASVLALGVLGIILTLDLRGSAVSSVDFIPSFVVSGMGIGMVVAPLLNIILSGVPGRDAGSASGVLTTFQQLGGAVGVAVIGVIFFSVLSGRAADAVSPIVPQVQAQLVQKAGLPAAQASAIASRFATCFEERARSSDPTAQPPGCGVPDTANPQATRFLAQIFGSAGQQALANDFVSTMQRVLFINAGIWLLTALVAAFLPRPQRQMQPALAAAH
ncbi:MAG: MFS transporter [Candidatus Dormibacteraeota bacterium]|nr:MFS transporter [Candidatus Dormibacteraeota bacterium]MBV9524817.1 MFS transporter [Candidatus Dormibacteraeota bacterium]